MLHSLYAISDLCVIPSLYEPFGLVALEAMASGCPCIVADTGGLREVVPGGERVGLRFRARDSASLATMMEKVLSDDGLRDRLVAEASEHILRFDWGDVARRTAEVYAEPGRRGPARGLAQRLRGVGHQRAGGRPGARCGSLAIARQTTSSSAAAGPAAPRVTSGGGSERCAYMTAASACRGNGTVPVRHS